MASEAEKIKLLILGSGPAGYTAAIYAARAELNPIMYTGIQPGGQLTITTEVENYPGYPDGITGPEMMEQFRRQAERFNTEVRYGLATSVDFSSYPLKVTIDEEHVVEAETVVISTGASAKWLGIESEQRLNGYGVSACAVCDGFFFRGEDVAIVGGGDTAAEEASYLAKICRKVFMIVRRNELRASKAMQTRVLNTPNIEIFWDTETVEILGDTGVVGVKIRNIKSKEEQTLTVTGFFVAIGHTPNTEIFKDQVELDEHGYIKTTPGSTRTSVEGVFAAGDVQDRTYRQAVTAAGTGCMAALEAERWLATRETEELIKAQ